MLTIPSEEYSSSYNEDEKYSTSYIKNEKYSTSHDESEEYSTLYDENEEKENSTVSENQQELLILPNKTMKNTTVVCLTAGGVKPPKSASLSWLLV